MTKATTQELMMWLMKKGEGVSGIMMDFVKDVTIAGLSNGEMEKAVKKANEYFDYVESSKSKYGEDIMYVLREAEGLSKYDISKDEELEKKSPNEILAKMVARHNIAGYDRTFKGWTKEIYKIDLNKIGEKNLTKEERVELEYFYLKGFRYLVRNEIGSVSVFVNKPHRDIETNYTPFGKNKTGYDFWIETKTPISYEEQQRTKGLELGDYKFIKWEDDPILISELIGE